jgi:hypothetical protein
MRCRHKYDKSVIKSLRLRLGINFLSRTAVSLEHPFRSQSFFSDSRTRLKKNFLLISPEWTFVINQKLRLNFSAFKDEGVPDVHGNTYLHLNLELYFQNLRYAQQFTATACCHFSLGVYPGMICHFYNIGMSRQ